MSRLLGFFVAGCMVGVFAVGAVRRPIRKVRHTFSGWLPVTGEA